MTVYDEVLEVTLEHQRRIAEYEKAYAENERYAMIVNRLQRALGSAKVALMNRPRTPAQWVWDWQKIAAAAEQDVDHGLAIFTEK